MFHYVFEMESYEHDFLTALKKILPEGTVIEFQGEINPHKLHLRSEEELSEDTLDLVPGELI
jgi:hypothetical protein